MKGRVIFQGILFLFLVYLIYQIIHKLLGGSWSIEQVILAFLVANVGWTVQLQKQISDLNSKFSEHAGDHKLIEHRLAALEAR